MNRVRALLQSVEPVQWLFYGDSITQGSRYTNGHRNFSELFSERVRFELQRKDDLVVNTATSGSSTIHLLERFDRHVKTFSPRVVFLMIGMNDCNPGRGVSLDRFRSNLSTLTERIQKLPSLPVLQTTCPILPGTSPEREPHFDAYMDAVRDIAGMKSLPLIDHAAHWKRRFADEPGLHSLWMNAYHPTYRGHRALAELIFRELGVFDPQSDICRLVLKQRDGEST